MTHRPPAGQAPSFWRDVISAIPDGLLMIAPDGVVLDVNEVFCKLVGFSRDEVVDAVAPYPFWPDDVFAPDGDVFRRLVRGERGQYELSFASGDGARIPVLLHASPLYDEAGRLICCVATVKDLSERIQMERALRRSEELWRSIAENPYDFVTVVDLSYRYTYVNHTTEGITREQLIGKASPFDYVAPEYHGTLRAAFDKAAREGHSTIFEAYTPQVDRWYTTIVGPIYDNGKVVSLSLLTRDITDAKRAEENLRHAQKIETLGTLAGGFAHDMNNLLAPILGNAELALRATQPDSPIRGWLEDVVGAAKRARAIVGRILVFGRRTHETRRAVAMPELVREALRFLANSLPATIEVALDVDESCAPVFGLPDQIHQAITNVCANAYQALKATGGRVEVTLDQVFLDEALARQHGMDPGPVVRITIKDDGPGMAPEILSRVFEPFFTTKPVGEGSGLGLAMVRAIVGRHGGAVVANSQVGVGTTLRLYLPAFTGPIKPASSVPTPAVLRRGQRVLCVDDEAVVLRLTTRVLVNAGYEVTGAASGQEALALIRQRPSAFDLVVSDETMPRLTGTQLAARIAELAPQLPVVIISGYGNDERGDEEPPNVRARLRKPLGVDELVTAIDVVLSDPERSDPF